MKVSDLVVLRYSSNTCYLKLEEIDPKKLPTYIREIDLKNGTWTHRDSTYPARRKAFNIGGGGSNGIIGIFDRNEFSHMEQMVEAATEAIRRQGPVSVSD